MNSTDTMRTSHMKRAIYFGSDFSFLEFHQSYRGLPAFLKNNSVEARIEFVRIIIVRYTSYVFCLQQNRDSSNPQKKLLKKKKIETNSRHVSAINEKSSFGLFIQIGKCFLSSLRVFRPRWIVIGRKVKPHPCDISHSSQWFMFLSPQRCHNWIHIVCRYAFEQCVQFIVQHRTYRMKIFQIDPIELNSMTHAAAHTINCILLLLRCVSI